MTKFNINDIIYANVSCGNTFIGTFKISGITTPKELMKEIVAWSRVQTSHIPPMFTRMVQVTFRNATQGIVWKTPVSLAA